MRRAVEFQWYSYVFCARLMGELVVGCAFKPSQIALVLCPGHTVALFVFREVAAFTGVAVGRPVLPNQRQQANPWASCSSLHFGLESSVFAPLRVGVA